MPREPVPTPTSCPLCGTASTHEGCRVCGGVGVVDAATAARWRSSTRSRRTSTTTSLADIAAQLVGRLRVAANTVEKCATPDRARAAGLDELAAEGQAMLDVIEGWRLAPADGPERAEVYGRVGAWQRRALERLTEP